MSNPFELILDKLNQIEIQLNQLKQPKVESNKMYSVKQLASDAGVSTITIRNWIREGKIKASKIGGRILIEQKQFKDGLEEVKSLKYKR